MDNVSINDTLPLLSPLSPYLVNIHTNRGVAMRLLQRTSPRLTAEGMDDKINK